MQPSHTEHAAIPFPRRRGILLHISSLPSKYGIGTYGREAYRFADMLKDCGADLWALLPMGQTGFGDSPYQSFSSFALNPYFLDLELLCEEGLLTEQECASASAGQPDDKCDYGMLFRQRMPLLLTAYARAVQREGFSVKLRHFASEHPYIKEYALYMAIKDAMGGAPWYEWPEGLKKRDKQALADIKTKVSQEYRFYLFLQLELFGQWAALRAYANSLGISVMGDMPIYCAYDSADCWAHPECFMFDADMRPTLVAGVPPDYFSPKGQLWGNPLYDWQSIRRHRYKFWLDRMSAAAELYDILRIDHFRGFAGFYSVPADAEDAVKGEWMKGCGYELFKRFAALQQSGRAPGCEIVAEDLGFITPDVKRLLTRTGFAGMQVMEFAFGGGRDNPHKNKRWDGDPLHIKNKAAYTGTHDNPPLAGWWLTVDEAERRRAVRYCGIKNKRLADLICKPIPCGGRENDECDENPDACEYARGCVGLQCRRAAWVIAKAAVDCDARYIIIPMQDVLCLGDEARMNTPGTDTGNWQWRMLPGQMIEADEAMRRLFGEDTV